MVEEAAADTEGALQLGSGGGAHHCVPLGTHPMLLNRARKAEPQERELWNGSAFFWEAEGKAGGNNLHPLPKKSIKN